MSRNRKRAKERRSRHPAAGQPSRPGVATARGQRDALNSNQDGLEVDDAPGPLEHATPDVDLANAQLALGRPALARDAESDEPGDFDEEASLAGGGAGGGDLRGGASGYGSGAGGSGGGGELAPAGAPVPAQRRLSGGRLINFLQGSWRELQRVQWPDRRQVMQATGVVIGFVIVAGVYLGLADEVATKLVALILK